MGVILATEYANTKFWSQLWLKYNSRLVTLAFKSPHIIPLQLKNKYCISKIKDTNFIISHTYREGSHCSDKLDFLGLSLNTFTWGDIAPRPIQK
jgi:hypothetical protein